MGRVAGRGCIDMLRVTWLNDQTGPDDAANYAVTVLVNDRVVERVRVTGHPRADHWTALLARTAQQWWGLPVPDVRLSTVESFLAVQQARDTALALAQQDAARLRGIVALLKEDAVLLQRDVLAHIKANREAEAAQQAQDAAVGHLCALHTAHLEAEVRDLQEAHKRMTEQASRLEQENRTLRNVIDAHGHRT